jgi:hypothetical protein
MPAIMIILNAVLMTGVVAGIVGLCAWGIISDRPFAAYLTHRAEARARERARRASERRRVPRQASGARGPRRPAIDDGV